MHLRKNYLSEAEKQLEDILKKIGLRGTNIPHYMAWLSFVFISIPGGNETISQQEMLQLLGWESENAKFRPDLLHKQNKRIYPQIQDNYQVKK